MINIIVLFNNCIINSIGNLKQSVSFGRNSVFVIWSKGQGLGLQTNVKIAHDIVAVDSKGGIKAFQQQD